MPRPVSIKSVLKRTLKQLDLYDIFRRQRALTYWGRVCGKEIAKVTKADKLLGSALFILVRDHIWASEISSFQYQYLKKYEKLLGPNIVKSIRFKASPQAFIKSKKKKSKNFNPDEVVLPKKELKAIKSKIEKINDEKACGLMEKFLVQKAKYERWLKKHGGQQCFRCEAFIEKGRTFCPICTWELERENTKKLNEAIENAPWLTFSDVVKEINPISIGFYYTIRDQKIETLNKRIVESMEKIQRNKNLRKNTSTVKRWIATLAMLKSGKKPAELNDDVLKKILSGMMYKFFYQ